MAVLGQGSWQGRQGGCWQGVRRLVRALCSSSAQETWYWAGSPDAAQVVMSGVRCAGTELALQQCQRHGPVHCPSGGGRFSAGVTCTAREYWEPTGYRWVGAPPSPGTESRGGGSYGGGDRLLRPH